MITQAGFYGGSKLWTAPATNIFIQEGAPKRLHVFESMTHLTRVYLPYLSNKYHRLGGPTFYILNNDNTYNIEVYKPTEAFLLLFTLSPQEGATLWIGDNSDYSGVWGWRIAGI